MENNVKLADLLKNLKDAPTPEELKERRAAVIARFREIIKNAQAKQAAKKE